MSYVTPEIAEYLMASQSVHTINPVTVLYLPFAHATHAAPSAPVCPSLQVQLVWAQLPAGELD